MLEVFDCAIIGGGINGCGCAADASLRGLSVVLFEQDDLASKTSSSSTKLIHGGLRYLENYQFAMVKKSLEERQTLLQLAPYLIRPQPFVLPYQKHMRPAWFLRLGLFFYDHLSRKNRLPKCKSIRRSDKNTYFTPLKSFYKHGFLFYDAATDDARLTLINALQAKNHGASIRPHSKVIHAEIRDAIWELTIEEKNGNCYKIQAKSLINASGPWVESLAKLTLTPLQQSISCVKGSHIVVPKIYEGQHAYFLQHSDLRVIFVIPYHQYSMIGTTEVVFTGSLDEVTIDAAEADYLLHSVNTYFTTQLDKEAIVYSWSGIRPLIKSDSADARTTSRDYRIEFTQIPAPIVTLLGGKITTYRQLAEKAVNKLTEVFPNLKPSLTKISQLPGTEYEEMNFEQYAAYARKKYSWLNTDILQRYLSCYGCLTEKFLASCNTMESLGKNFGNTLYQAEVDYLVREEWASCAEDILFRRTKLGLSMSEHDKQALTGYMRS